MLVSTDGRFSTRSSRSRSLKAAVELPLYRFSFPLHLLEDNTGNGN